MQHETWRPSGLDVLNAALEPSGWQLDCVLATPGDGRNFSRLSADPETLDRSYGEIVGEIGARGIAIPRAFSGYDQPIELCRRPGYAGDDTNPNPPGLGLVMPGWFVEDEVAFGATWADAQADLLVHPSGVIVTVSCLWHQLPGLLDSAVMLMAQQVNATGYFNDSNSGFSLADVWVITSPAARHGFLVDERGAAKLEAVRPGNRLVRVFGREKSFDLDLSGLTYDLITRLRDKDQTAIPPNQILFDVRCTLTHPNLPSKRLAGKEGRPAWSSGILAGVMKRR